MADYKYGHYVTHSADPKFDPAHPPGAMPTDPGIYKCQACGCEIVAYPDNPLPPSNHHQHGLNQDAIAWRLIVAPSS